MALFGKRGELVGIFSKPKLDYSVITSARSIFEQKYFFFLHKAFLNKMPDKLLDVGSEILKKRISASKIILHLTSMNVRGQPLYSHDPKERHLDIHEQSHINMVPGYVNVFYNTKPTKPETVKVGKEYALMIPLITRTEEIVGIMEVKFDKFKKLSKMEIEETEYYAEAFMSIIDDYRKQKEQLGMMRDMTGMVILLVMWTVFFMSTSLIYFFSPGQYEIVYFFFLAIIIASVFITFSEHLYSLKGWGVSMGDFLKSLHTYLIIAMAVVVGAGLIKYFSLFGVAKDMGGGLLVFAWTWKDIMYPISVPLQELGARALPHVILRKVVKDSWYKKFLIITISSMVYGFGHLFFGLSLVALTFLLGVLLGTIYEYKRNFWGVCLVHMIVGYLVMTGLGYDLLLQMPK